MPENNFFFAGGYPDDIAKDIEAWIVGSGQHFKHMGTLPFEWRAGASTSSMNSLIMVGNLWHLTQADGLIRIRCTSQTCNAEQMAQKLEVGRHDTVAMVVPESIGICALK